MLPWIWFMAFLLLALVLDRFLTMAPANRQIYRAVVLILAALWLLALTGVLHRLGI